MYPFRRVLVPTDFSTAAQWAFDEAIRVAGRHESEIIVLHIRMTWESDPHELRLPADAALYEYAEQQELDRLRERVRRANAKISTRMVVKNAPEAGPEICSTAAEENVDLVVIATHARHHVAHLLIGSTTLSLLQNPPAPVLAVRYGIRKKDSLRRLVVPVHFKQKSQAALDLATTVARDAGAEIHLLTICSDSDRVAATALLDELAGRAGDVKFVRYIARAAEADRQIMTYCQKADADVLFLNADQEMLSDRKIDIIRHAPVPVLVVPGGIEN